MGKIRCGKCGKLLNKCGYKQHLKLHKKDHRCPYCGKLITHRKNKFCSLTCSNRYNIKFVFKYKIKKIRKCPVCGKETKREYCSCKCANEWKYREFIKRWLKGKEKGYRGKESISKNIRRYLFEINKNKCQKCGWNEKNLTTGKIPLTVNHKDGNHRNNRLKNLELICPNCHSLTNNYGNLNRGKGRKIRKIKKRKEYNEF